MKMNEIKYLPKSNAFADVYSKATGMPFIGEMMAAAAGNGGDTELKIKSLTLNYEYVEVNNEDGWVATIETNKAFAPEELSYMSIIFVDANSENGFEGNVLLGYEGTTVKVLCAKRGEVAYGEEICNTDSSSDWWVSFQIVNQEDNIVVTDFCYTANAPTIPNYEK